MTGGNFRLSNLLASIGYSQLLRLNSIMKKRKAIDNFYKKKLSQNPYFTLMNEPLNFEPIKFGFPLLFKKKKHKENIMKMLNKNSTLSRPGFYTLNKLKHLKIYKNNLTFKKDFINSEIATKNVLVLPMHHNLKSYQVGKVCKIILDYCKN